MCPNIVIEVEKGLFTLIINLRYHIASLVAVFLALGIGIVIGGAMLGNNTMVEKQKQLTDRLEAQLNALRQKNDVLAARANTLEMDKNIYQQFSQQAMPALIGGRLAGRQIAVIETNSYGFSDGLLQALQTAGAQVVSVTTVLNGLEVKDKKGALTALGWRDSQEDLTTRLAWEIAAYITTGRGEKTIKYLQEQDLLRTNGKYGQYITDVVIVGGAMDEKLNKVATLDIPLIDYFQQQKISVYGVEESVAANSYMREYQKKRISTVDNIDTVPGQVALVMAMTGKPGHYGAKSTAQKLLPALDNAWPANVGSGAKSGKR
ncbi:MAG: copper transporter [Bacillota bacterium]|uniref:copper transporter n=1 Tax=Desulfurispora thermophila TaxID=265470 RepID=UPI000373BB13|nr:copper transporter [Desulfurispora thermophila]